MYRFLIWNTEYENRAWCRVELMMANAFCTIGNRILVVPNDFKCTAHEIENRFQLNLTGSLTNENDRMTIEGLHRIVLRSRIFSCYKMCILFSKLYNVFYMDILLLLL